MLPAFVARLALLSITGLAIRGGIGHAAQPVVKMNPYVVAGQMTRGYLPISWLQGLALDLSRECPMLRLKGIEAVRVPGSPSNLPLVLRIRGPTGQLDERFAPWSEYYPMDRLPFDGYVEPNQPSGFGALSAVIAPANRTGSQTNPCSLEDCAKVASQYLGFVRHQWMLYCSIFHFPLWWFDRPENAFASEITPDEILLRVTDAELVAVLGRIGSIRVEGGIVRLPIDDIPHLKKAVMKGQLTWHSDRVALLGVWRHRADLPALDGNGLLVPAMIGRTPGDSFDIGLVLLDTRQRMDARTPTDPFHERPPAAIPNPAELR